jgi:hypothetical protein
MSPEASRACLGCGAESYLAKWMEFKEEPGKASANTRDGDFGACNNTAISK